MCPQSPTSPTFVKSHCSLPARRSFHGRLHGCNSRLRLLESIWINSSRKKRRCTATNENEQQSQQEDAQLVRPEPKGQKLHSSGAQLGKPRKKTGRRPRQGYVDDEGLWQGNHAIQDAWSTIAWRMTGLPKKQRYPTRDADCQAFGTFLRTMLSTHQTWAGSTHATALHRLTRMRIYHGSFVHPCKQVFEKLVEAMAGSSQRQEPRDIATALWSLAKVSELDRLESWEDLYTVQGLQERIQTTWQQGMHTEADHSNQSERRRVEIDEAKQAGERGLANDSVAEEGKADAGTRATEEQSAEIEELVRPFRQQGEDSEMALKAKPPRLNRSPSTKEYYSHRGALPTKRYKWENPGGGPGKGAQASASVGKDVVWVPAAFSRDLDAVAREWDAKDEEKHDPQSVALVLWSFAALDYSPDGGRTLHAIQTRLLQMSSQLSTIDVCNTFWGHGQLKAELPIGLQQELLKRMDVLISEKELQIVNIPVIMQACVKLRLQMTHQIFTILLEYLFEGFPTRQPLNKLTPGPLAEMLTAVAAAKHPFKTSWAREWAKQCYFRLKEFSLADLAAILAACQKMDINPMGGRLFNEAFKLHPQLRPLKKKPGNWPVSLKKANQETLPAIKR